MSYRPHNVPFVVLGATLLWFGWFGFNAGSEFAAVDIANHGESAYPAYLGMD